MANKIYSYINAKKENLEIEISEEQENIVEQARQDYQTSFNYIQKQEYDIWRGAIKSYHMSTYDRKQALGTNTWKQNISIGMIRSFVDVMISSLNEKPLVFVGTGVNKAGITNKIKILKTLNYISDASGFHKQLKKTMKNGLIVGQICMRVGYIKTEKEEKITSIINNTFVEETVEVEEKNHPYATNVSIFKVFPDIYSGPLRNVTERDVVSYGNFIETFGHMIRSNLNESPLGNDDFLALLSINDNNANFDDYGNITNQIHEKVNDEYKEKDKFRVNKTANITGVSAETQDEDTKVTEGLIEFKITFYESRAVLLANGYPVYFGKNPYGFIPYVIQPSTETEARFGEGIPYQLGGLENVANSFINNYFDSARSISNPTLVVNKNLMINDNELEDGTPGGILYVENNDGGNAVTRLDKGGLQTFDILPTVMSIGQQITGISEYNLGVAARERTASGALAVTQSSQKRLSPYVSTFLDSISIVAKMWLTMVKKYRTEEQMIYILDEDGKQIMEQIQNTELAGEMNISLNAEGMFGSFEELELQKLITMYQTLAPSGFITSPEMAKEIIKKTGFDSNKFMAEPGAGVIPENMKNKEGLENPEAPAGTMGDPGAGIEDILKNITNPQVSLGHGGKGSPYNPNT